MAQAKDDFRYIIILDDSSQSDKDKLAKAFHDGFRVILQNATGSAVHYMCVKDAPKQRPPLAMA